MNLGTLRWIAAAALATSVTAEAATVTVGSLSRDTSGGIIVDSLNNRQWLGWDVTKGKSYAQTLAAIGAGGIWEGWRLAHNGDAQAFMSALLGATACDAANNAVCLVGAPAAAENVTGEDFVDYRAVGSWYDYDYVFFVSDNGTGQDVGIIENWTNYDNPSVSQITKYNEWADFASADAYADPSPSPIGWLLYRDTPTTSVPEPGSVALAGLALLAAATATRRQRA